MGALRTKRSFAISSSLLGVLAQRLVRKLCPACKKKSTLPPDIIEEFDIPESYTVYEEVGCPKCNFTGFSGRQAVGELLIMDDEVKMMLKN